jgi:hypothetical protein
LARASAWAKPFEDERSAMLESANMPTANNARITIRETVTTSANPRSLARRFLDCFGIAVFNEGSQNVFPHCCEKFVQLNQIVESLIDAEQPIKGVIAGMKDGLLPMPGARLGSIPGTHSPDLPQKKRRPYLW